MLPKEKATSSVLGTIVESEEEGARNGEQSSFLIQFCQTLHVIMSHCSFTTLWSWFLLFCLPLLLFIYGMVLGLQQLEMNKRNRYEWWFFFTYVVVKREKFWHTTKNIYQFIRVQKTCLKIWHCDHPCCSVLRGCKLGFIIVQSQKCFFCGYQEREEEILCRGLSHTASNGTT